jgi:hypothetical protein
VADKNEAVITEVEEAIRRYLRTYPNAADNVEGITHWWLARQRFGETKETVEQALERLVAEGEVTKTVTGEGKVVYSYAKRKMTGD